MVLTRLKAFLLSCFDFLFAHLVDIFIYSTLYIGTARPRQAWYENTFGIVGKLGLWGILVSFKNVFLHASH